MEHMSPCFQATVVQPNPCTFQASACGEEDVQLKMTVKMPRNLWNGPLSQQ